MNYRGRFAPSPTGALHFGSLVAAVASWLRARAQDGAWIIRIEDLDPPREVPGASADILATLGACGMESDEPVIYQSRREPAYRQAFERLRAAGAIFPCWCSRSDLAAHGGAHRGACIAAADPQREPAWRVRVPARTIAFTDAIYGARTQDLRAGAGDFVVRRVEGWYAYHLAVVVDDATQTITEVVRGADLLESVPRQIYLQELLCLSTPAYLHVPLALDDEGRKLSKQDRARPVDRADPLAALRAALAFLGMDEVVVGTAATPQSMLQAAIPHFDLARLAGIARSAGSAGIASAETV